MATVDRGGENEPEAVVPGTASSAAGSSAADGSVAQQPAPEPEQRPTVVVAPWGANGWAIVVQAGSDSADLGRVLAEMPAGLEFSEAHGDVDVILVYQAPETPCPGPKPGGPADTLAAGRRRIAETRARRCVRTR